MMMNVPRNIVHKAAWNSSKNVSDWKGRWHYKWYKWHFLQNVLRIEYTLPHPQHWSSLLKQSIFSVQIKHKKTFFTHEALESVWMESTELMAHNKLEKWNWVNTLINHHQRVFNFLPKNNELRTQQNKGISSLKIKWIFIQFSSGHNTLYSRIKCLKTIITQF